MSIARRTSKEYTFDLVIEILKIYIKAKILPKEKQKFLKSSCIFKKNLN